MNGKGRETKMALGKTVQKTDFDGIKFKATAVSKDATTLNKDNHYININDLKISVNSEVSIDADKKKDDKK